ncbi:MAG: sulfatase [Planctomycetota bacterium]
MRRLAIVLLGLGLLGCGEGEKDDGKRPNVLLITIDTLRADRLGCYGFDRPTSPVLDGLAARGTLFETARVPIARTTQSLASLMTGLYPPLHGVRDLWGPNGVLPADRTTLAEVFGRQGYRTGGAWAVPFFDENAQGLAQGLGEFQRSWTDDVEAKVVTDAGLEFLGAKDGRPFFLWLHYRDPHMPYGPPPAENIAFGGEGYRGPFEKAFYYYPIPDRTVSLAALPPDRKERKAKIVYGGGDLTPQDHRRARDLYAGEVAATDAEIGRLLEQLESGGLSKDTLIIVTADHGESFGEHGYYYDHGEFTYDTCLRVPLLIAGPGVQEQRLAEPVRTVDVFSTVLEAAGAKEAEAVSGESLWGALTGRRSLVGRPLFAETGQLLLSDRHDRRPVPGIAGRGVALVTDRWKIVHTPGLEIDGGYELYDLESDPSEQQSLASAPPDDCPWEALKKQLAEWARAVHREPKPGGQSALDPDQIRRLEGVGYIMGGKK